MGLKIPADARRLYEDWFNARGADARGGVAGTPSEFASVSVDALTFFRMVAPSKATTTVDQLCYRLFSEIKRLVKPGGEVYVFFDTQVNMPMQREAVAYARNPPATPAELKKARSDPTDSRVEVNGRLFKRGLEPMTAAELDELDLNRPFLFPRAMNSRAGKERVWGLLEEQILVHFAQDLTEFPLRVVVDGSRTGPRAVAELVRDGGAGSDAVVRVTWGPRKIAFGEADQKAAHAIAFLPRAIPGPAVVLTVDTDMLAQMLCIAARRPPELRDAYIGFFPHSTLKCREIRYIDTIGLPVDGSGSSIALLMALGGTDYSVSLAGAGLSPAVAIDRGISRLRPALTVNSDGLFATVDAEGVVAALRQAATGKNPRDVFSFDREHGCFISKPAAVAEAARLGIDGPVRKRKRLLDDFHADLQPILWLLSYWSFVGIDKTPAAPDAVSPTARLFDCSTQVTQFLRPGPVHGAANLRIA